MDDIFFENIGLSCAAKAKNPVKQVHFISGVSFVVIHESHVQRLALDKNETWLEQISTEDGILLRILRND